MKKPFILACTVFCIVALGACGGSEAMLETEPSESGQTPVVSTTGTTRLPEEEWVAQNRVIPDVLPTLEPGSIQLLPTEQLKGELWAILLPGESAPDIPLYFRYCYYESYSTFWTLVYPNGFPPEGVPYEYSEFVNSLPHTEDLFPNGTVQEMPLVSLVKHFQVPKHVLVAEVEKMKKASLALGNDLSAEISELPNPDIIYTFDNDIINAYYRRENPVAPDWLTEPTTQVRD